MRIEPSKNLLVAVVNQMYPAAVVLDVAVGNEIDRAFRRHRETPLFKSPTTDVNKGVSRQQIVLRSGKREKIRPTDPPRHGLGEFRRLDRYRRLARHAAGKQGRDQKRRATAFITHLRLHDVVKLVIRNVRSIYFTTNLPLSEAASFIASSREKLPQTANSPPLIST